MTEIISTSEAPYLQNLLIPPLLQTKIETVKERIDFSDPDWPTEVMLKFVEDNKRQRHSSIVGYGCQLVAEEINKRQSLQPCLDPELLRQAGILHDVGHFEVRGDKTPWHELKGAVIVHALGFPVIAKMIARHGTPVEGARNKSIRISPAASYPETLADQILALVDLLVLPGGKVVGLEERLADIYTRYQGKEEAYVIQGAERRFRQMYNSLNHLLDGDLLRILKQAEGYFKNK